MIRIKDLSPKLTGLETAERELYIPPLFQDTPGQLVGGLLAGSGALKQGKMTLSGYDEQILFGDATDYSTGVGLFMGKDGSLYKFRIGDPAGTRITWDGSSLNISGFGEGSQAFVSTLVWTATDFNTASWSTGSIKLSGGTTYSIASGNTGNIAATTYIYLDPAVSSTILQTTTTATSAIGGQKILIATVEIGVSGSECYITTVGSPGTTINGNRITTGSLTADRLAATLTVTNILNISTGGHIKMGQTAWDTGSGFFLGDVSGTAKFSIGDSSGNKLTWDGSAISITGSIESSIITGTTITGGTIRTVASGARVQLNGSNNRFEIYDGSGLVGYIQEYSGFLGIIGDTNKNIVLSASNYVKVFDCDLRVDASIYVEGSVSTLSGELSLDADGSSKVGLQTNIDMHEHNIDACDTIFAFHFTNRSDRNLKKNITDRGNNLADLLKFKPVEYNWKTDGAGAGKHVGLLAQDVEAFLPSAVITDDKGVKGISYAEIVPVLIGAIQELSAEVKALKAKIK